MGAPAKKTVNWMEVPDEELATDLDDTDSAQEVEKCQKEEEEKWQKEAEAKQKWEAKKAKQGALGRFRGPGKWEPGECIHMYQMHKAGAYVCHTNWGQEAFSMQVMHEGQGTMEHKKQMKKVADDDDDDEIVILSSQKTKR
ncbi:hypothetical protein ID866_13370 [Astraeus odoratus]|nr:hypothetical protein ID866_13370 [Astraeus odoratus]